MKVLFRSYLALALLVFGGIAAASAQSTDAKITETKVVAASADDVWGLLRQMDDIQKYSSAIATVEWSGERGVGGQRICRTPDGQGYFKEGIIGFDDTNRSYSYALLEGVPAKGMVNNFKVVDLGYQKSMIVWTSNYEEFMTNPQMNEEQCAGFLNQSITEMLTNVAAAAE